MSSTSKQFFTQQINKYKRVAPSINEFIMTDATPTKNVLNRIAQLILCSPILVLISPLIIYWIIEDIRFKRLPKFEPPPFKPKVNDLIERLSVDTIEAAELIYDPLDAVPRLPFGHNHACWVEFKSQLEEDSELWSFEAKIIDEWQESNYCEGYACVRQGSNEIGACFFTRISAMPRFDHPREDCSA